MKSVRIFFVSWLVMLAASPLFSQQKTVAIDSLFYRGVGAFQEGQYQQALDVMRMLDKLYPNHARLTGSLLMQGKTLYQLVQYEEATGYYDRLLQYYPHSQYIDDAHFGLGQIRFQMGDDTGAVKAFLKVVTIGGDAELMRLAAEHISDILERRMSAAQMKALLKDLHNERERATVTLKLARREMDRRQYQTAKFYLEDHLSRYPQGQYDETIKQMLSQAEALSQGQIKVGVILPLTGPTAAEGQALLDGLKFAAQSLTGTGETNVQLVVEDSGGELVRAVAAAQRLCENREIIAIIGELESDMTAAIAGVAQAMGVPLLAPTARMDGIAALGDYIFQLAASHGVQAAVVARYATIDQQLKRFALFYPADPVGKASRDAFAKVVKENGGEIIVDKHYFEGASNWKNYIGEQMTAIRRAGLEQMVSDSLIYFVHKDEWDAAYEHTGNIHYVDSDMDRLVDSTVVSVTAFDAIFMPVYSDEVIYVAPHYFKQNFKAQALGGVDWNQPDLLVENPTFEEQTEGMIFPSHSYYDPDYFAYYQMVNKYRNAKLKSPGDLEILGYDIIQLLIKIGSGKSMNRRQIKDGILDLKRFQGIRGPIVFNAQGANSYVHLLKYRNGKILKIK